MPDHVNDGILEHNRDAAAIWRAGGRHYDLVSFAMSDALAHTAQRLSPKPGDKCSTSRPAPAGARAMRRASAQTSRQSIYRPI